MNPLSGLERPYSAGNKWITVQSELKGISGENKEIKLEIMGDGMPRAVAFFDIDKTLAHLDFLYKEAINNIFPGNDADEIIETFIKGFRLGNSFREFDRMHNIYSEGKIEWKDPEVYIKERLNLEQEKIDSIGNIIHDRAALYLKLYGEEAAKIADRIFISNPEHFLSAQIGPLYTLLEIYKWQGVLMFGFTANAASFVKRLAVYLKLSDYFLDIATDETMEGGGKEIAVGKMLEIARNKGILIPKEQLIFVGDSIRGDIGSGVHFCKNNMGFKGYGILVVEDAVALNEIRHLVNTDEYINSIIKMIPTYAFVVNDVPKNKEGNPSLLSADMDKFFFRL
ncbi:MAG: hypothetical protein WAV23_00015 [Minisyncoccia bacterium]